MFSKSAIPEKICSDLLGYVFKSLSSGLIKSARTKNIGDFNQKINKDYDDLWNKLSRQIGNLPVADSIDVIDDEKGANYLNRLSYEYKTLLYILQKMSSKSLEEDEFSLYTDAFSMRIRSVDKKLKPLKQEYLGLLNSFGEINEQLKLVVAQFSPESQSKYRKLQEILEFCVANFITLDKVPLFTAQSVIDYLESQIKESDTSLDSTFRNLLRLTKWMALQSQNSASLPFVEDSKYQKFKVRARKKYATIHLSDRCTAYPKIENPERDEKNIDLFEDLESAIQTIKGRGKDPSICRNPACMDIHNDLVNPFLLRSAKNLPHDE
jgi:hypothetical protein